MSHISVYVATPCDRALLYYRTDSRILGSCINFTYSRFRISRLNAHLTTHGICVNLAHVGAGVVLLYIRHVQLPCIVSVVRDRQPGIVRHHVRMYRQNRSGIRLYPGYLEHGRSGDDTSKDNSGNCK